MSLQTNERTIVSDFGVSFGAKVERMLEPFDRTFVARRHGREEMLVLRERRDERSLERVMHREIEQDEGSRWRRFAREAQDRRTIGETRVEQRFLVGVDDLREIVGQALHSGEANLAHRASERANEAGSIVHRLKTSKPRGLRERIHDARTHRFEDETRSRREPRFRERGCGTHRGETEERRALPSEDGTRLRDRAAHERGRRFERVSHDEELLVPRSFREKCARTFEANVGRRGDEQRTRHSSTE